MTKPGDLHSARTDWRADCLTCWIYRLLGIAILVMVIGVIGYLFYLGGQS
jgi:hypothetical protein